MTVLELRSVLVNDITCDIIASYTVNNINTEICIAKMQYNKISVINKRFTKSDIDSRIVYLIRKKDNLLEIVTDYK